MPFSGRDTPGPPGDKGLSGRKVLPVGPGLCLVHDPCVHQGKTGGMDKGLFLAVRGRLCAGESAGFGLPVLKARGRTVFSALKSVRSLEGNVLVKTFSLERALAWHLGKQKMSALFTGAMELFTGLYMALPAFQRGFIRLRSAAFILTRASSSMETIGSRGTCIVTCETSLEGLAVRVDAAGLEGQGTVILLNEVEGNAFTILKEGSSLLREGEIPAWRRASFGSRLESPALGVGFSLAPGIPSGGSDFRLFCGREVGYLLDWAGFALTCRVPVFSYQVLFAGEGLGCTRP